MRVVSLLATASLFIISCGGGGGGNPDYSSSNNPTPINNYSNEFTIQIGSNKNLKSKSLNTQSIVANTVYDAYILSTCSINTGNDITSSIPDDIKSDFTYATYNGLSLSTPQSLKVYKFQDIINNSYTININTSGGCKLGIIVSGLKEGDENGNGNGYYVFQTFPKITNITGLDPSNYGSDNYTKRTLWLNIPDGTNGSITAKFIGLAGQYDLSTGIDLTNTQTNFSYTLNSIIISPLDIKQVSKVSTACESISDVNLKKDCYKVALFSYLDKSSNQFQGIPMMAIAVPQAPSQYNPVILTKDNNYFYLRSYSGYNSGYSASTTEISNSKNLNPYFKPSDAIECAGDGCVYLSGIFGGEKNKTYDNNTFPFITGIGWNNYGNGYSKVLEIYNIAYNGSSFTGKIRYRKFDGSYTLSGIIADPATDITLTEHQVSTSSGSYQINVSVE